MTARGESNTINVNRSTAGFILGLAVLSAAIFAGLAIAGDLRERLPLLLASHAVLTVAMIVAWRLAHRDATALRWALGAALLFRLIAALGPPTLSDDIYRYLWDGRVQLHGISPYRHAPADPALEALRDEHWERINHPELPTVYPPVAQMTFVGLAAVGAGPTLFKIAMGMLDFCVVLALGLLLRRLDLPPARLVLYAWNPLAIVESAGSGHIEPLGALLVILAAATIIDRRPALSTLALAGGIQAKLLPVVLLPGYLRRLRLRELGLLVLALAVLAAPYLAFDPGAASGLRNYAERWEHNSLVFPAVHGLLEHFDLASSLKRGIASLQERWGEGWVSWDFLYRHVWPQYTARLFVAALALAWIVVLAFRRRLDPSRETFLVLAGVLLLSPTLHPWYLLWILPFAAAYLSWGWLCLALLIPLSYLSGSAEVPWSIRVLEYAPPLVLAIVFHKKTRERGQPPSFR